VPYLTHCLLVSWLILLCKIRNLYGVPKRTMRYLLIILLTWAKWKILIQISISLFLKSYGGPYGEFS
jgi:hypothetical protein